MKRDILLIGGTGTLGNALLERFSPERCVVFSRDELKQADLKRRHPGVVCLLGDVRDKSSLKEAMTGIESVFHVAALKHVDVLEAAPRQAFATNVQGTINSAEAAMESRVRDFYFTSTDKAVLPINVYGMTKAISERYLLNLNDHGSPRFRVFRWGNIVGSRGSAIGSFVKTLKNEKKAYVTDKRMTRFWMRIEDAVSFMLTYSGDINKVNFPRMKAAPVLSVISAVAQILGIKDYDIEVIGIRPGEKLHECLFSSHEGCITSDCMPLYTNNELIDLVRPVVEELA